uniref:Secreted protein n=1 Tax=Amblyomma cajennense TaxID=34607 RepID=A0A023FBZ3_AMBCJ
MCLCRNSLLWLTLLLLCWRFDSCYLVTGNSQVTSFTTSFTMFPLLQSLLIAMAFSSLLVATTAEKVTCKMRNLFHKRLCFTLNYKCVCSAVEKYRLKELYATGHFVNGSFTKQASLYSMLLKCKTPVKKTCQ